MAPQGEIGVQVAGRSGVPSSGAAAVVLNLTGTGPTSAGSITAYPSGTTKPLASNLNFGAGQTIANQAVVPLGSDGQIRLANNSGGTIDLLADVAGYFRAGEATEIGTFVPVAPTRVLDTRLPAGAAPVAAGANRLVQITGQPGVPALDVGAVVMNTTVTAPTRSGYITAFANGTARPVASNLNFTARQTIPNLVMVPVGLGGRVALANGSAGTVDLVGDVAGYYRSN